MHYAVISLHLEWLVFIVESCIILSAQRHFARARHDKFLYYYRRGNDVWQKKVFLGIYLGPAKSNCLSALRTLPVDNLKECTKRDDRSKGCPFAPSDASWSLSNGLAVDFENEQDYHPRLSVSANSPGRVCPLYLS